MPLDALVDSAQLDADLEDIADAIRDRGGTSASLTFPAEFISAIQAIPSGAADDSIIAIGTVSWSMSANPVLCVGVSKANMQTRRSYWKQSGDHSIGAYYNSSNYVTFTGYYPIKIPTGATKAVISASGVGQYGVRTWTWDGSKYVYNNYDSGWENLPATNDELTFTNGSEYLTIVFRASSGDANYSTSSEPYNVSVSFI